jgi:hypothetical protein
MRKTLVPNMNANHYSDKTNESYRLGDMVSYLAEKPILRQSRIKNGI